ncbi:MAG: hypothetical protein J7527_14330 [Chitinophagaceae bacterium]|nr:hypothetical protein [Chitinophagaceae bacterium]
MNKQEPLLQVCDQLGLSKRKNEYSAQLKALEEEVNRLLLHDFDRLIAILYRVDVNEHKLKLLLKERPDEDAARLISSLLIERQAQKIKTRDQFNSSQTGIDENERW